MRASGICSRRSVRQSIHEYEDGAKRDGLSDVGLSVFQFRCGSQSRSFAVKRAGYCPLGLSAGDAGAAESVAASVAESVAEFALAAAGSSAASSLSFVASASSVSTRDWSM